MTKGRGIRISEAARAKIIEERKRRVNADVEEIGFSSIGSDLIIKGADCRCKNEN